MARQFRRLTDRKLIEILANAPEKSHELETACREYWERYHDYICKAIARNCRSLSYAEGLQNIEDLAIQVHQKLFDHERHALKCFRGKHDFSFKRFLGVIASRITINEIKKSQARRRVPKKRTRSLNASIPASGKHHDTETTSLLELIPDIAQSNPDKFYELADGIEACLDRILKARSNKNRDRIIFSMMLYDRFTAEEIARHTNCGLTAKSISNICSELKPLLQKCLRKQGYDL